MLRPKTDPSGRPSRSFPQAGVAASFLAAFLGAVTLAGVGCSRSPGPSDYETSRTIDIVPGAATKGNYGFSPNPAICTRNTLVIWTNHDAIDHRVVSTGGFFDSGLIKPGQSYQLIFRETGNFRYYDAVPASKIQGVLNVAP